MSGILLILTNNRFEKIFQILKSIIKQCNYLLIRSILPLYIILWTGYYFTSSCTFTYNKFGWFGAIIISVLSMKRSWIVLLLNLNKVACFKVCHRRT